MGNGQCADCGSWPGRCERCWKSRQSPPSANEILAWFRADPELLIEVMDSNSMPVVLRAWEEDVPATQAVCHRRAMRRTLHGKSVWEARVVEFDGRLNMPGSLTYDERMDGLVNVNIRFKDDDYQWHAWTISTTFEDGLKMADEKLRERGYLLAGKVW